MTDPDEVQLSKLAKRVLSMPPKQRENSKLGKRTVSAKRRPRSERGGKKAEDASS